MCPSRRAHGTALGSRCRGCRRAHPLGRRTKRQIDGHRHPDSSAERHLSARPPGRPPVTSHSLTGHQLRRTGPVDRHSRKEVGEPDAGVPMMLAAFIVRRFGASVPSGFRGTVGEYSGRTHDARRLGLRHPSPPASRQADEPEVEPDRWVSLEATDRRLSPRYGPGRRTTSLSLPRPEPSASRSSTRCRHASLRRCRETNMTPHP